MKIKNSKNLIVFILAMFLWVSVFIGVKTMAYASSTAFNPGTTIGLGQVDLSINHKITFESDVGDSVTFIFEVTEDSSILFFKNFGEETTDFPFYKLVP